jgi:integrase
MAWLEKRSNRYRIKFRYCGQSYQCSLNTCDYDEAERCLSRLEENLRLLVRGKFALPPPGADLALFLLSDGKLEDKPRLAKPVTLGELADRYRQLPEGIKEANTRYTENIHLGHLLRILGKDLPVPAITTDVLQRYVEARSRERARGKPISHITVRKEIGTLTAIWNKWALPLGFVTGAAPTKGLIYRKVKGKAPFRTRAEIEQEVARGDLTEEELHGLWESLFLTLSEIELFLGHAKQYRHLCIYAMLVFAAHTGARRSELLRSRRGDFNFDSSMVTIREKKRDPSRDLTFRCVPMSPLLRQTIADWFSKHPGGQFTICQKPNQPLTAQLAAHHFRWVVEESKWEKLAGWHVFRHSFASNCALKGLDQRLIDAWMGHQTEEMRRRYRHLFPDHQQQAIGLVFGNGK